jgi:prophage antirepressor-like protein
VFGKDGERYCRFCGARWSEFISLARFIDMKSAHSVSKSQITGVTYFQTGAVQTKAEKQKEAIEMRESNALQIFSFEDKQVRVTVINYEPCWVVNDICEVLDIKNTRDAISRIPKDDVAQTDVIDSMGRKQKMNVVNESGLYELIFRSDKPEAQTFRHWITHEVLPALRKTGEYTTPAKEKEKARKHDEVTMKRLEIMERNANWRMAKLILDGVEKFKDVMTPESRVVAMAKYVEFTTGQDMTRALPAATEKWYSATAIGEICGVSSARVGKTAKENGLKAPEGQTNEYGTWIRSKSKYSGREVMTWIYYEKSAEWFKEFFKVAKTA